MRGREHTSVNLYKMLALTSIYVYNIHAPYKSHKIYLIGFIKCLVYIYLRWNLQKANINAKGSTRARARIRISTRVKARARARASQGWTREEEEEKEENLQRRSETVQ